MPDKSSRVPTAPGRQSTTRTRWKLGFFAAIVLSCTLVAAQNDKPLSLPEYIASLQKLRQAVLSSDDAAAVSLVQRLPTEWQVEAEDQEFTVRFNGIRDVVRSSYARTTIASQLELLIKDAEGMRSAKGNYQAERAQLTQILSRREFRNVKGESWFDKLKQRVQQWLLRQLNHLLLSSSFPIVSRIVIWGLLALAVAVATWWVVRACRQENIYTRFTGSPEGISAKPWRDWHAEAQAAAREGRWRDAVHLLYWAGISFLEAQGAWRPDLTRTPREYLRLLPSADPHRRPLQQLTRNFEQVWYGNDAATAQTFASASALLEELGCR
jgi:hypothetical protein